MAFLNLALFFLFLIRFNAINVPFRAFTPGEDYSLSFPDDHPFSLSKSFRQNSDDIASFNSLFSDDHPFSPPMNINHDDDDDASSIPSLLSDAMVETSTSYPVELPTDSPSQDPTFNPTKHPTSKPTVNPTKPPTEQWSNSPQKHKFNSKQKKRSKSNIDDDELLQNELLKQTNDTLIKLYSFQNHSDIETLTRFQNELISQHRYDLILLTYLDYSDPKFERNLNWISKGNRRVKEYYSNHHKLATEIHKFVEILDFIFEADQEEYIYIQQVNDWFVSIVQLYHLFGFVKESEALMECINSYFSSLDNQRILNLLYMIEQSFDCDPNHFHLTAMDPNELWALITFYAFAAGGIYNSKMYALCNHNKMFENITSEAGIKYLGGLKDYAASYYAFFSGHQPGNEVPNIRSLFQEGIGDLNHFCIAECIHGWKFKEHKKENKHRNIHVVLIDDDTSTLQELLNMMQEQTGQTLKMEQFIVTPKRTKGTKIAFELTQCTNKISEAPVMNKKKNKRSKRKKVEHKIPANEKFNEGVIKLYINERNDAFPEAELTKQNADDLVITVGPLDESADPRIKSFNSFGELILSQMLEIFVICGNSLRSVPIQEFLLKVNEWLNQNLNLFKNQNAESKHIAMEIFEGLNINKALYIKLRHAYLGASRESGQKLNIYERDIGALFEFAKRAMTVILAYQDKNFVSLLNKNSILDLNETHVLHSVYPKLSVGSTQALDLILKASLIKVRKDSVQIIKKLSIVLLDDFDKMKILRDEIVIGHILYEWKSDDMDRQKDISVFLYDDEIIDKFDGIVSRTSGRINRDIEVIKYNTSNYPEITLYGKQEIKTKRFIYLYYVGQSESVPVTLRLTAKYPQRLLINPDICHSNNEQINSTLCGSNIAFGQLLSFLDTVDASDDETFADGIKRWLNLNLVVYGYSKAATQRIAVEAFNQFDRLCNFQNMTKYQEQIYKMMKASYLNGLQLDFKRIPNEQILDVNVMELLLVFVEQSFIVTVQENEASIFLVLNSSQYARKGEKLGVMIMRMHTIFHQRLSEMMGLLRRALVTREIFVDEMYHSIEAFCRSSTTLTTVSNQVMICHIVNQYMKQDEKRGIMRDISIVYTSSDNQKRQQLKEGLMTLVNNTSTEIISYSVGNDSHCISKLPEFTID